MFVSVYTMAGWYGHVSRSSGLAKTILQGTVKRGRRQGRQRKRWEDVIREWTDLEFAKSQRAVENREKWRKLVAKSFAILTACWVERRIRDRKIASSNPGRSGGINFFSRVNFVC